MLGIDIIFFIHCYIPTISINWGWFDIVLWSLLWVMQIIMQRLKLHLNKGRNRFLKNNFDEMTFYLSDQLNLLFHLNFFIFLAQNTTNWSNDWHLNKITLEGIKRLHGLRKGNVFLLKLNILISFNEHTYLFRNENFME